MWKPKSRRTAVVVLSLSLLPVISSRGQEINIAQNPEPILGEAPRAPKQAPPREHLPPSKNSVDGGFSVDNTSREQVRGFYRAVYPSSDNVAIDTTADVPNCTPGTNSIAFRNAVLRRINWFRAMAGLGSSVTFLETNNFNAQEAAVMMSKNTNLSHQPPPTWSCYTAAGAAGAGSGNLALGFDGPGSITGYIWDFGSANYEVGHRRWILYPQTEFMGTGDVPQTGNGQAGTLYAANCTIVFDSHYFDTRPETHFPFVSWPPPGYVPAPIVFPYWSFALTNSDLSVATVSMTSNGVPISASLQNYTSGFGENTLVWVPFGLDPTLSTTVFPFNGLDTVYNVTVGNIRLAGGGTTNVSYSVTVFDPATPGADYVAPVISGPAQPSVGIGNTYTVQAVNDPNVAGYQWRISQRVSGNVTDNVQSGLANFSISPAPTYPIITNAYVGGANCFHLDHDAGASQFLQMNSLFFPATNTTFSFKSFLGYASPTETAHAQVSTDGGATWKDLYVQTGNNTLESAFTLHTLSLSNYAGQATSLRFAFLIGNGSYDVGTQNYVGWSLQNIVVTNVQQLVNQVTNTTASTQFSFVPTQTNNYNLEARGLLYGAYPLDWGPAKLVSAIPSVVMSTPIVAGGQVKLDFTLSPSGTGMFKLLQKDTLGAATWITNTTATLTTNIPGSSFRFTTPTGPAGRYYRVLKL